MRVGIRIRELMVHPVISDPLIQMVLEGHTIGYHQ